MSLFSRLIFKDAVFNFKPHSLQIKLKNLGYYTGKIDGDIGPKTKAAVIAFKKSAGLNATDYVDLVTWKRLSNARTLPWMTEISKVLGLHEVRDNAELSAWLRSDGKTLGDPTKLPWCGDAAETAIKNGLPNEPLPAALGKNPYWARNWAMFGKPCGEVFGAAASFIRGNGGHIAFLVGVSQDEKLYRVRGGNQSNMVNDTWIAKSRLLALRWPSTIPVSQQWAAPRMNSTGSIISTNEA